MVLARFCGLHQFDEATHQFEMTAKINPRANEPHDQLARVYWSQQRALDALAEEREAATLARSAERLRDQKVVSATYSKYGVDAARRKSVQLREAEFKALPLESDVFMIAVHYGGLYDQKKTLEWLNRAVRDEDGRTRIAIKTAPEFDFLRSDPRFHDLLRRLGFPE